MDKTVRQKRFFGGKMRVRAARLKLDTGGKVMRFFVLSATVGLALVLATVGAGPARAETLWYNGDFDFSDAAVNARHATASAAGYDDFHVVGGLWHISGVWSNILTDLYPACGSRCQGIADYEIRSGMSAGNGGSLLYSGTGVSASVVPTGRSGFGFSEFSLAVDGLSLDLGPGTYWLMVRPVNGDHWSFLSTTSGAGSVGSPAGNDENSFVYASWGANFLATSQIFGAPGVDFSMGVRGVDPPLSTVPEPGSLTLLAAAVTGFCTMAWRRHRAG
jgi:PEP-CTERM motif-containing protein